MSGPNYRYQKVTGSEKGYQHLVKFILGGVALLGGYIFLSRSPARPWSPGLNPDQFVPVYRRCIPKEKPVNVTHEPHYPNQTYYMMIVSQAPDSWVIRAPEISNRTEVIILVSTKNNHERERIQVRRSWANRNQDFIANKTVRVIFLLGDNPKEQDCLLQEQSDFGDLLIVKSNDSYRHLVYKILMGYRYLAQKYPNSHVVKVFKDTVVDINQLMEFIPKMNSTPLIYGYIFWGSGPVREESSQWFVPESAWPSKDYPEYAKENFYIMSRQALKELMKPDNLGRVKVVEVDDVFFTGILRKQAGFNVSFLQEFALNHPNIDKCPKESEKKLIASKLIDQSIESSYNQFMNFKERGCTAE